MDQKVTSLDEICSSQTTRWARSRSPNKYIVCCYFEEALQPCTPTVILKSRNSCKAGEGGGGGGGGGGRVGGSTVHSVCTTQCQRSKFRNVCTSSTESDALKVPHS